MFYSVSFSSKIKLEYDRARLQLKSLMVTSNASYLQWLLASKFSNRCSAQCFI